MHPSYHSYYSNVYPQQVPATAPAFEPTAVITSSFASMSLDQYTCEQEEQKRRDEALARLLQQAENQEIQKKTTQEESDSQLALKLLLEEKLQIEKEAELQKVSEQVAKQMQFDEALAEKLAAEEEKNRRSAADLEVARKLAEAERIRLATLAAHESHLNQHQSKLNSARQHAVAIHNKHCFCGNTATYNNNHVYQVHNQYCGKYNCIARSAVGAYNNQGALHKHDTRCCITNHIHTVACPCVYRKHLNTTGHTAFCCQVVHVHNDYCNCVCK